jgi:molybdenum cofactor synthesis domain-containing protein
MEHTMEIVCIGNELLIGKTLNTNENWLANSATLLGVNVKRISTVGDDVQEISKVLIEALDRKPRFIVVTGGLGPTYDDKTLEGVARSLNRKLCVNPEAFRMVKEKYEDYLREGRIEKVELTPSRVKMATIPEGSEPIPNPVGTAPGVKIYVDKSILIILPGVPSEMKAIFDDSVAPLLVEEVGYLRFFEKTINVDGIMESSLAPLIDKVRVENPYVYIKSHPKGEERIPQLEIHLSTKNANLEMGVQLLNKAGSEILRLIEEHRFSKKR